VPGRGWLDRLAVEAPRCCAQLRSSQEHESRKEKSGRDSAFTIGSATFRPCAITFTVRRRVPFNNGRWRVSGQEMLALTNSVRVLGIHR
jgi:hypothetical protein